MDLSKQEERYASMASPLNTYAEKARAGEASSQVVVILTAREAAEALVSLGQVASQLAWALSLPGNDDLPEIVMGEEQLDSTLDVMATIWQAVALSEEAVNLTSVA